SRFDGNYPPGAGVADGRRIIHRFLQSLDDSVVYGFAAEVADVAPPFQEFEESGAFRRRKLHRLPNSVGIAGIKWGSVTLIRKQKSPLARAFGGASGPW